MRHVLIVEDDADLREVLRDLLAGEGFEVDEASNGEEALRYLRTSSRHPCIVLLDLMMPVVSGWEVLETLRAEDHLFTIPIAVMSATPEAGPLPRGLRIFKKPVRWDALLQVVREACVPEDGSSVP